VVYAPIDDPFDLAPVDEVHLERTPLEVVIFQVRFPGSYIPLKEAIDSGAVARALGREYPFAVTQNVLQVVFQPGRPPQQKPADVQVLQMSDASQVWTLNVSQDSVSVTTTKYESRKDLLARASKIFEALAETASPPSLSRLGVRYINRVTDLAAIDALVQDGLNTEVQPMHRLWATRPNAIRHSMNDLLYEWPGTATKLQARLGILAPGQVLDGALSPAATSSWVLDIDTFDEGPQGFDASRIADQLKDLAQRAYRFFRWIVTPKGLAQFGAEQ